LADSECLFCRIVAGEIPTDFLHEDELVVAFPDVSPKAPTHILLIPREHLASAAEFTESHAPMLGRLFATAAGDRGLVESGFRLVTNAGPDAGQSVDHLHVHLLGGRKFGWPPG
jgi:histidine triad (HIT) family protein